MGKNKSGAANRKSKIKPHKGTDTQLPAVRELSPQGSVALILSRDVKERMHSLLAIKLVCSLCLRVIPSVLCPLSMLSKCAFLRKCSRSYRIVSCQKGSRILSLWWYTESFFHTAFLIRPGETVPVFYPTDSYRHDILEQAPSLLVEMRISTSLMSSPSFPSHWEHKLSFPSMSFHPVAWYSQPILSKISI